MMLLLHHRPRLLSVWFGARTTHRLQSEAQIRVVNKSVTSMELGGVGLDSEVMMKRRA